MRNIAVQYVDTTKYVVRIHQDDSFMDWEEFTDLSEVVQFRDKDWTSYRDLDEYTTENGKLLPSIQAKLKAGKMFTISYSRYSSTDGGFYRLDGSIPSAGDEVDSYGYGLDGFIILNEVEGMSYEQRKELAKASLDEYTDWANGNVYWVEIETPDGKYIDSCGGFIGDNSIQGFIKEQLPDVLPENVEIVGVYPDGSEYETYFDMASIIKEEG